MAIAHDRHGTAILRRELECMAWHEKIMLQAPD
jgi:hypothetical protein